MDFNDVKTEELIEIYKKVNEFLKFLEKEQQDIKSHPKGWLFMRIRERIPVCAICPKTTFVY